jgi:cyclophilin family peptidyl-prolyl cis-trans isomerase
MNRTDKLTSRRLRLESLEPRLALHAGQDPGPDYSLATGHVHSTLSIFIDGDNQVIPANVGALGSNHTPGAQMAIVHTHDTSGTLHIEPFLATTPPTEYPTLGDFFEIWRTNALGVPNNSTATLSATNLMGRQADSTHEVRMYVDGRRNFEFENHLLDEGESIVLVYAEKSAPESLEIVRFTTNVGSFDVELYPEVAPITVANFLNYVRSGRYQGTVVHRSVPNFVIQGGGYTPNGQHIQTDAPIQNEFQLSNLVNTMAMAKLGGNPNSATSEWFINLTNNAANLDNQNGGFTVFGRVLTPDAEPGMVNSVVAAIAALPIVNNSQVNGAFTNQPVLDASSRTPVTVTVGVLRGEIHGKVFLDTDQDGVQDAGEAVQSGWTVFVDADNDGVRDIEESSATTAADGYYVLAHVPPGTHTVRIEPLAGYQVVQPATASRSVIVHGAAIVENQNFGVALDAGRSEIRGRVFYDVRGNGRLDADDWPLSGWEVYLDADRDGSMDTGENRVASGPDGTFVLSGLHAGSHVVRLQTRAGYRITLPISASRTVPLDDDQTIGRQNFAVQLMTQSCTNADLDDSGQVTRADLALLVRAFQSSGGRADLDGDGDVDLRDLLRLGAVLGQHCSIGSPSAAVAERGAATSPRERDLATSVVVGHRIERVSAAVDRVVAEPDFSPTKSTLRARRRANFRPDTAGARFATDN